MNEQQTREKAPSTIRSRSPSAESRAPYHDDDATPDISVKEKNEKDIDDHHLTWEYLTYESTLPDFTSVCNDPSAPQPPNLKQYDSPFGWSNLRKNTCLALSCIATFLAAYSAGVYSFTSIPLRERWNLSAVAFNTGVTTWCIGFAVSPMFLAPFSEINGRRPIFLASGLIFLISDIGCVVTDSFAGMLVARFFQGAGASTFSTMVGGVLSDVYHAEFRNTPMAIYSSFALGGTGIGPMFGGFIVENGDWRWTFWAHAIVLGVLLVLLVLFFKETRGSVLLSRKAKAINKYYDKLDEYVQHNYPDREPPSKNIRYKVASDENRATISRMLYLSVTTPFKFLGTEPVVFFFSMWAAFAWGILYMTFGVIPLIYKTTHNFDLMQQSGVFSAIAIGSTIATFLSIYQDTLLKYTFFTRSTRFNPSLPSSSSSSSESTNNNAKPHTHNPETRLYLPCLLSPLLPIGLFWFGWTSTSPRIPWIVPTIGLALSQIGIFSIYLAVFNYLADTYHRYASSALAGQSFCRNVLAAVFPLFTDQMFRRLGFGGAGSLLGGIGLLLTAVPWVLVLFGRRIRARSKVASEILEEGGK